MCVLVCVGITILVRTLSQLHTKRARTFWVCEDLHPSPRKKTSQNRLWTCFQHVVKVLSYPHKGRKSKLCASHVAQ